MFTQPAAPATDKKIVPVINDKQVAIPHATVELYFKQADEYINLTLYSRVYTIGFTFRFGKSFKAIPKPSADGAGEMERVGTGN